MPLHGSMRIAALQHNDALKRPFRLKGIETACNPGVLVDFCRYLRR
jgi:hypothetical protein